MRVLFVGRSVGQAGLMQEAMRRRGHLVTAVDPNAVLRDNRLLIYWAWHTGALGLAGRVEGWLREAIGDGCHDVAFVDGGELLSAGAVRLLRRQAGRVALFNRDNPFVARDGRRWRTLLRALPEYDLFVTPRQSTADRAAGYGARRVLRVNFFADEAIHRPGAPTAAEQAVYGSPVAFVGTWFPERGPFMETLLRRGVPLRIIGQRWERAPNYAALRQAVVPGYLGPQQYAAAVRSATIAIAMLSKGNADLQTSRSSEIPAMGVALCAERTPEHVGMYEEGEEAVFWSSAEECADRCLSLLADRPRLERLAAAGRRRVLRNDNWAESTLERILTTVAADA